MLNIRPDHITNGNQAATLALLWAIAIQFEVQLFALPVILRQYIVSTSKLTAYMIFEILTSFPNCDGNCSPRTYAMVLPGAAAGAGQAAEAGAGARGSQHLPADGPADRGAARRYRLAVRGRGARRRPAVLGPGQSASINFTHHVLFMRMTIQTR